MANISPTGIKVVAFPTYSPPGWDTGDYYRAHTDEIVIDRYKAKFPLGFGHSADVWLAEDLRPPHTHVALKILTVTSSATNHKSRDELGILKSLREGIMSSNTRGSSKICQLIEDFTLEGSKGIHTCLVLEALGPNLRDVGEGFEYSSWLMPFYLIKRISQDILEALMFIHEHGVVHTDLKLDNVLAVGKPVPYQGTVTFMVDELLGTVFKLTDFSHSYRLSNRPVGPVQPMSLRSPEVTLEAEWDEKVDIWALGCVLFQLATRKSLINHWVLDQTDANNMSQIIAVLGDMPQSLLDRANRTREFFDEQGQLLSVGPWEQTSLQQLLTENYNRMEECPMFMDFVSKTLTLEPRDRWDEAQLLGHPWFAEEHDSPIVWRHAPLIRYQLPPLSAEGEACIASTVQTTLTSSGQSLIHTKGVPR